MIIGTLFFINSFARPGGYEDRKVAIMQKTKILYKVNQYIIGGSRIESYYFETEKEAKEYYEKHEYWELAFLNFING